MNWNKTKRALLFRRYDQIAEEQEESKDKRVPNDLTRMNAADTSTFGNMQPRLAMRGISVDPVARAIQICTKMSK